MSVGEVVTKGQALIEIARQGERCVITSPALGVVSRCRVRVGDEVANVTGVHRPTAGDARADQAEVRAVARMQSAPPGALWAGMEAIVEVEDA